jgi:hypothetical protein
MQPAPVAAPLPGADRGRATAGSRRTPPPAAGAAARRDLGDQIARLERDLAEALAAEFPRPEPARPRPRAPVVAGPRLLSLGELELVRDDLAVRLARLRSGGAAPLLAAMLADPAGHRGAVVTSADLGEPGCRTWAVRPRLGPLGRLAGWWRVVVSSGCPLGRSRA